MSRLTLLLHRFRRQQAAAAMVEYGILLALIAALIFAVARIVGSKTNNSFQNVNGGWADAGSGSGPSPSAIGTIRQPPIAHDIS